jgi:hypothetical protein
VSPDEFVRFLGIPAVMYWCRVGVVPARARSKSLAAKSRAAGGREEGDGEVVDGGWTEVESDDWVLELSSVV